ncbi:ABC transporter permease [Catalinimonas niigatensis]|uniref:ABC transporter permease n=1 Tax=Catalinimonas niigatensis TaxID=1397264 RepID=UPI0026666869|nr:ABC transporter permease [Catalinimonas niigatensis]WPP50102.1 ABC transporter permease [Catalinimonas niigatensis]
MNKIGLIIKREYLTRVRKKSFIVMTLLGPLVFAAIVIVPVWLASMDGSDTKIISVIDESGLLKESFLTSASGDDPIIYQYVTEPVESIKQEVTKGLQFGLLYIPDISLENTQGITLFSESSPSMSVVGDIERMLQDKIKDIKLERSNISREALEQLETDVDIQTISLTETGEQQGNANVASVVGYVGAFLIYTFIFLYGAQVMRGVMEEKSNRIVEIVISSVRPFQLMMGKIIGVASVGLTQFLLWIALTFGLATVFLQGFSAEDLMKQRTEQMSQNMPQSEMAQSEMTMDIQLALASIDITGFVLTFLFYFLGGYLLYGALFAAIGSAADSNTDTQQFMLPISTPLILSIVTLGAVLNDPNGTLAFWLSMIPFTAPVTMMMRVPFGIPTWQLILSMTLLIGGFMFTTWVAGRIYRVGILMHGAKVNYKIIGKWLLSNH